MRRATGSRTGRETREFPAHQSDFHHAAPVWQVLAGWREPLDDATSVRDLPAAASKYVEFVAETSASRSSSSASAPRERVLA